MSDGPWSFDNHMLALRRISHGEDPKDVPLNIVEMWVEIHNLPYGFMCKAISELIGSYILAILWNMMRKTIGFLGESL
jgi:14-3-3 protein epsilon